MNKYKYYYHWTKHVRVSRGEKKHLKTPQPHHAVTYQRSQGRKSSSKPEEEWRPLLNSKLGLSATNQLYCGQAVPVALLCSIPGFTESRGRTCNCDSMIINSRDNEEDYFLLHTPAKSFRMQSSSKSQKKQRPHLSHMAYMAISLQSLTAIRIGCAWLVDGGSIRMRSIVLRLPLFVYLWWRWRSLGIVMQIILAFGSGGRGRGGSPFCNIACRLRTFFCTIFFSCGVKIRQFSLSLLYLQFFFSFSNCQRISRRINYPVHSNPYYYR